jgi:hypothetical protein
MVLIQILTLASNFLKNRPVQGVLLLLVSLLFGLYAHHYSKNKMLLDWEKKHAPSDLIWRYALESKGYQKIEKSYEIHRLLRSLPLLADTHASVWCTENKFEIAIFHLDSSVSEPLLYLFKTSPRKSALPQKSYPKQWEFLGKGWIGFEKTLSLPAPILIKPISAKAKLDPRALQY